MLSEFEERPYSTANEMVAALRPSHVDWEGKETIDTGWVFRGQSNSNWSLQSSANRFPSPNELFCAYYRSIKKRYSIYTANSWEKWVQPHCVKPSHLTNKIWEERITQTSLLALTQATLVREFLMLADRAGHPILMPDFLWHIENHEEPNRPFFGRFFRGEIENKDMVPFAIAQHHGVPTGLLDWTYNPLIAAFFASEPHSSPNAKNKVDYIAVWALKTQIFNFDLPEIRRLTVPPGMVPFLDAQEGLFTWCPSGYSFHLKEDKFSTFDDIVLAKLNETAKANLKMPLLRKLTLPIEEVPALLKLLWREKVTRAHLMPTFDNVTASLKLKSTWLN